MTTNGVQMGIAIIDLSMHYIIALCVCVCVCEPLSLSHNRWQLCEVWYSLHGIMFVGATNRELRLSDVSKMKTCGGGMEWGC